MTQQPDTLHFDGTNASVLAVMRFVDAGRTTTVIDIHADTDPAKTHITFPTPTGRVRVTAGDVITRGPDGSYSARPAVPPTHLPKGTNAEDCPACEGTNPPYPFLCPGPPAS